MADPALYRDFQFPLNVFMYILTSEEGKASYLHYGLFEGANESIAVAQERSTGLLLARLPPPPARILDVGAGLGTTLARLVDDGYDAQGITPDEQQVAMIRARHRNRVRVTAARFETFESRELFDVIVFQESSQYIDPTMLFAKARALTSRLIVLDEFAAGGPREPGGLHSFADFIAAAERNGFVLAEDTDVSAQAAPSIDYVDRRIDRYRDALVRDLGVTAEQLDHLVASGERYRQRYARGEYVYRILQLNR